MKHRNVFGIVRTSVKTVSRRTVLRSMGAAASLPLVPALSRAQSPATGASQASASATQAKSQLPLRSTGLEHMGTVVPDVTAAARFHGRLFNPEVHKEKDPPLRYYVTLGVGYLAFGSRANEPRAFFDHFCALVQDYDGRAMAQELQSAGLPAGRYGIIPDPDGVGLQLLATPGGLAKSTVPAGRIVEEDALVRPKGLSQVVLRVASLDKSLQFYRKFFGKESRSGTQIVFQVADTRLVLEPAASGESACIDRICVNIEPFDRAAVARELTKLGASLTAGPGKTLRFRDPMGLGFELIPV